MVILFFLGVYNFAFKKSSPINVAENSKVTEIVKSNESSNLKDATILSIEKIYQIFDQDIIGAVYDKKADSILFYSSNDGMIWRVDESGKGKQQISKEKVTGTIKSAVWSPDRSKNIIAVDFQGKNTFYEYEMASQKFTILKDGLDTAAWDNMSGKIFYKYFDSATKQRTLNNANPDGSGWQKLADINSRNLSIAQIPLTSIVSFWNSPAFNEESVLQTVGVAGGELKTIFRGRFGGDYLWSPNGSISLISSLNEKNGRRIGLGTVDLNGNYSDLNVPTFVSKCVWSSDSKTVYYALAGAVPENVNMPDDYQNGKFNTKDTFWKLDITTGKKERVLRPEETSATIDANNLFLSPTEDALYFTNKIDKKLYKIEL